MGHYDFGLVPPAPLGRPLCFFLRDFVRPSFFSPVDVGAGFHRLSGGRGRGDSVGVLVHSPYTGGRRSPGGTSPGFPLCPLNTASISAIEKFNRLLPLCGFSQRYNLNVGLTMAIGVF